jgi:hypothetical protein
MSLKVRPLNIVIGIIILGTLVFSLLNLRETYKLQGIQAALTDSISAQNRSFDKVRTENLYLSDLLMVGLKNNYQVIPKTVNAYEMKDRGKSSPINLLSILKTGKKKLILRYTEIGCNACADSSFRLIRGMKNLKDKYETLVLVDFTDYNYYLKWKKIGDISEKILWVKKGDLPFLLEDRNLSYLFVVNSDLVASSFFVPNSLFTKPLNSYLSNL